VTYPYYLMLLINKKKNTINIIIYNLYIPWVLLQEILMSEKSQHQMLHTVSFYFRANENQRIIEVESWLAVERDQGWRGGVRVTGKAAWGILGMEQNLNYYECQTVGLYYHTIILQDVSTGGSRQVVWMASWCVSFYKCMWI
jgi:hypothetical protein